MLVILYGYHIRKRFKFFIIIGEDIPRDVAKGSVLEGGGGCMAFLPESQ